MDLDKGSGSVVLHIAGIGSAAGLKSFSWAEACDGVVGETYYLACLRLRAIFAKISETSVSKGAA